MSDEKESSRWFTVVLIALMLAGLFGVALKNGWIGHRSITWGEFKNQLVLGKFKSVSIAGRKVTAVYRDPADGENIILYTPSEPLPEADVKWLMYKSEKHGVALTFEKPAP